MKWKLIWALSLLIFASSLLPSAADASEGEQVIIINKKKNQLAFFDKGRLVKTYSVATGKTSKLTPEGVFYIREKIKNRPYYKLNIKGGDPKNPLGDRWMGLSYNEKGSFPIGIHGNNNEATIGKYVSAGCIRMKNAEIRDLYEKIQKKTKVVIVTSGQSFVTLGQAHAVKTIAKN